MKTFIFVLYSLLSWGVFAQNNLCQDKFHIPICHSGAGHSHNDVDICPDFGSLWGHLVQHPDDYIGPCIEDVEANVKLYACNAGLKHKPHTQALCFDRDRDGIVVPNCDNSRNCICSNGDELQTQHLRDYFEYGIADFTNDFSAPFSLNRKKAGKTLFEVASDSQGNHVLSEDPRLTFQFGSTRIGTEYFVDFCWKILDSELAKKQFKISSTLSVVENLFLGVDYLNTADVELKWEIYCDSKFSGQLSYSPVPYRESSYAPFLTGLAQVNQDLPIGQSCFIRYKLRENEWDFLRPHDLKKITVLNNMDIEPKNPIEPNDLPITFCHVEPQGQNSYNCRTHTFPNTQALRLWMMTGNNDHREWRQNNQHNYRGVCEVEGPCSRPR